jgi:3-oxoadipate enol-lactonase
MEDKVEINGRTIAYSLLGQEGAPAVVLSHALGSSRSIWGYQLPLLTARFRVLAYDLPGHGESEAPSRHTSFDDLAADAAALLDHIGFSQAAFVGLSIGGMIAQHFALRYPQRLRALVLSSTGCQTNEAGQKVFAERIAQVSEVGIESQVDGSIGRWFTPQFVSEAPATVDWVKRIYRKTSAAGFINGCRAIQELDTFDRLSEIAAPTLLIPGEFDQAFPESISRTIQSRIKGARLSVLAGAAHIGNVERPHYFNEMLLQFLAEAGRR